MHFDKFNRRSFLRRAAGAALVPGFLSAGGCANQQSPADRSSLGEVRATDILKALHQFSNDNLCVPYTPQCVHGLNCQLDSQEKIEFVFLVAPECHTLPACVMKLVDSGYRIQMGDKGVDAKVRTVPRPITKSHADSTSRGVERAGLTPTTRPSTALAGVQIGTKCTGPSGNTGAVGWNIALNFGQGYNNYCLTSSHVISAVGSTNIGSLATLDTKSGHVAMQSLVRPYVQGYPPPQNIWDVAVVKYDTASDALASSICPASYPDHLVLQLTGLRHYTAGPAGSKCTYGDFSGFGNRFIQYPNNVTAYFICQALFSSMSQPSDSGAVIHGADHGVVGMVVGADDGYIETCANPIYLFLTSSAWVADNWTAAHLPKFIQQHDPFTWATC